MSSNHIISFKTKIAKMRFQIKPHIFFLFWMTVFSDTWTTASSANETPGLNETTLGLNFETPKM